MLPEGAYGYIQWRRIHVQTAAPTTAASSDSATNSTLRRIVR